jgi:hypothetical protein
MPCLSISSHTMLVSYARSYHILCHILSYATPHFAMQAKTCSTFIHIISFYTVYDMPTRAITNQIIPYHAVSYNTVPHNTTHHCTIRCTLHHTKHNHIKLHGIISLTTTKLHHNTSRHTTSYHTNVMPYYTRSHYKTAALNHTTS